MILRGVLVLRLLAAPTTSAPMNTLSHRRLAPKIGPAATGRLVRAAVKLEFAPTPTIAARQLANQLPASHAARQIVLARSAAMMAAVVPAVLAALAKSVKAALA